MFSDPGNDRGARDPYLPLFQLLYDGGAGAHGDLPLLHSISRP